MIDGSSGGAGPDPGILANVFGWWPLLWTIRLGLLIVVLAGTFVFVLVVSRFFRWNHIVRLWKAPFPQFREIGGKVAGIEATAKLLEADAATAKQIEAVNKRIDDLVEYVGTVVAVVSGPETDPDEADEQA